MSPIMPPTMSSLLLISLAFTNVDASLNLRRVTFDSLVGLDRRQICTPVPAPATCERSCGPGNVPCITEDNCYNPSVGESCCSNGSKVLSSRFLLHRCRLLSCRQQHRRMRSVHDTKYSASTTGDHKLGSLIIEQCRDYDLDVYHTQQYRSYVDVLNNLIDDIVDNLTNLKLNINNELIQFRSRAGQSSLKHGVESDNNYSTNRSRLLIGSFFYE
ncbi:hypothetical protein LTR17_004306 [Elasticomyces elasticus]|nr:hypothetical protein LTR17_004306 [Elasticomyces elasticus]